MDIVFSESDFSELITESVRENSFDEGISVVDEDDADEYTREWFAWQNSLFGELIVHLVDNGKLEVLNSIKAPKYKKPSKRR